MAQTIPIQLRERQTFNNNEAGLINPVGFGYSQKLNIFFFIETKATGETDIILMTPLGERLGSVAVDIALSEKSPITVDDRTGQLLIIDSASQELINIKISTDLEPSSFIITRTSIKHLGSKKINGLAVDSVNGRNYFLDGSNFQIIRDEQKPLPRFPDNFFQEVIGSYWGC
jgi:hypothetical protein